MAERGRIAIVAHATVPQDPRITKQARALAAAGYEVDVLALRDDGQPPEEQDGRIRFVRLPVRRRWHGVAGHLAEYVAFTAVAAVALAREHRRRHYAVIQVATVPDFLVASAAALKLGGVPLLLDLHEDMPAFFRDRFTAPPLRPLVPLVGLVSRASASMADALITVHEPLRRLAIARGVRPERISVVMNGADTTVFDPSRFRRRQFMEDGTLRLIHHSALQRIYGLEIAVEAVARLPSSLPVRLDVYGDGPFRPAVEGAVERFGVADRVLLHGRVPLEQLPDLLAAADIGLVPTLPEPYLQLSLSTKLLEYAAMCVPVIASDLATFREHLSTDAIRYVAGGDVAALADAIAEVAGDPAAAARRAERAHAEAAPYAWERQVPTYLGVVERLVSRR